MYSHMQTNYSVLGSNQTICCQFEPPSNIIVHWCVPVSHHNLMIGAVDAYESFWAANLNWDYDNHSRNRWVDFVPCLGANGKLKLNINHHSLEAILNPRHFSTIWRNWHYSLSWLTLCWKFKNYFLKRQIEFCVS